MKYIKQGLLIVVSAFIALVLCGCDVAGIVTQVIGANTIAEAELVPKIAFGTEELSEESNELIMTADEVEAAETDFSKYRGDLHYNTLSEDEKTVYRAYEYALENGYLHIYVDDLIISDYTRLGEILNLYALDSPLLEQNLLYEHGDFIMYYDVDIGFFDASAALDGYYIYVKNFESELFEKKKQAIKKAEEIVNQMPKDISDTEKARYLHKYTLSNVEYYDYKDISLDIVSPYLYDGLINGKTHCDGSANMYSLLMSIAGIECVEKQYSGDEAEIGHTWNFTKLDGVWYNIDATAGSKNSDEDHKIRQKRLFAFEDRMQPFLPDFANIYPKADEGIDMPVDAHIEKITGSDFVKKVRMAFAKNGNSHALLLVDDYSDTAAEKAIQKLANTLNTTVYWQMYEVVNNKTAVIVFK